MTEQQRFKLIPPRRLKLEKKKMKEKASAAGKPSVTLTTLRNKRMKKSSLQLSFFKPRTEPQPIRNH